MRQYPKKPPTVDRLRKDIDRGKTGDKVAYPDPAAAPLGTDEEAGGNPPSESQLARERLTSPTDKTSAVGPLIYVLVASLLLAVFAAIVAFA